MPLTVGFAVLVLASSVAVYAGFGRYADWQNEQTGVETNYMLAAKIAEARRMVKTCLTMRGRSRSWPKRYTKPANTVRPLRFSTNSSGWVEKVRRHSGRLARAMYYRDARVITAETHRVIERALSINALDVQTRMLLGEDAFMHQRYDEAVSHWKMLLDAGVAPAQQRALRNAIANAESRARLQD